MVEPKLDIGLRCGMRCGTREGGASVCGDFEKGGGTPSKEDTKSGCHVPLLLTSKETEAEDVLES